MHETPIANLVILWTASPLLCAYSAYVCKNVFMQSSFFSAVFVEGSNHSDVNMNLPGGLKTNTI